MPKHITIFKKSIVLLDLPNILYDKKGMVKSICSNGFDKYKFEGLKIIAEMTNEYLEKWNTWDIKCIILDCDNVLWGGIAGEDAHLNLGNEGKGKKYLEFQREVVRLYKSR